MQFYLTFNSMEEASTQKESLLRIKDFIFHCQLKNSMSKIVYAYHKPMEKMKEAVYNWKIKSNNIDEDEPKGIQINETEGEHTVEGKASDSTMLDYGHPIKTKKCNIGT
jgi:hypothetical protein